MFDNIFVVIDKDASCIQLKIIYHGVSQDVPELYQLDSDYRVPTTKAEFLASIYYLVLQFFF